MSAEQGKNLTETEIINVWSLALSWLSNPRFQHEEQEFLREKELVEAIHARLMGINSVKTLLYLHIRNKNWCTNIAQSLFPADFNRLRPNLALAAALGLRWVELQTGKQLDPRKQLPQWLSEWAV